MIKRGLIIGDYETARYWTLTGWEFSPAEQYTNFLEVPGRAKGPLDLSTALTEGVPTYKSRTLTATFECSDGSRLWREERISEMVNSLDGFVQEMALPDDSEHFIVGRVHVARLYNDMAHASVQVTAICEPWRYNKTETRIELRGEAETQTATLPNLGRLSASPILTVAGSSAFVEYGTRSWALSPGTYEHVPGLVISPGGLTIKYSGGSLVLTYREAVL